MIRPLHYLPRPVCPNVNDVYSTVPNCKLFIFSMQTVKVIFSHACSSEAQFCHIKRSFCTALMWSILKSSTAWQPHYTQVFNPMYIRNRQTCDWLGNKDIFRRYCFALQLICTHVFVITKWHTCTWYEPLHEKTCLPGFRPAKAQLQRLARALKFWI